MASNIENSAATSSTSAWWKDGIRFECQGSGRCCTSHGEFGFVFLSIEDRRRMARHLRMTTSAFTRRHCQRYNGAFHLREDHGSPDCLFLKGKRCGIYEARPTQCRTWPFWPEVMNAKAWKKDVASFCPGVGKGPVRKADIIEKQLKEQTRAEESILRDARR